MMEFGTYLENWFVSFMEFLPNLIAGVVFFIVTILASGFIAKWTKKIFSKKISNKEILELIFLLTRWTILIIGTIFALDMVNFDVTGFIAGLGVAGFTIGFALQDMAKNFISGILLLYRQPFNLGELVKVDDYLGKVKEINMRDTVIITLDGELVIIPNRIVFENPIINYTHTQYRRRRITIGLGYEEDADRAIEIFLDTIKSVPGVELEPSPIIQANELGDSVLVLSALFWVDQQENDLLGVNSEVIKAIKVASEIHNINLPYPIQTVLMKNVEE